MMSYADMDDGKIYKLKLNQINVLVVSGNCKYKFCRNNENTKTRIPFGKYWLS